MNSKIDLTTFGINSPDDVMIFHKEIAKDTGRFIDILKSSSGVDDKGFPISKSDIALFQISTKPRTLQRRGRQPEAIKKYKQSLRTELEKHKDALSIFKNKWILVYLIAYLDKQNYENYDVDNIPKHFCDILKEFTSDEMRGDRFIETLIVEKRGVDIPNIEKSLCEEFLVFVTGADFKKYLFK